ncbi:CheY-like superfamily [Penicillium maclennaniae]|uniref:CheY-like superfamily n=1 Tax=Penicillium maclennaniae TaxID=1343394 RepID=UPI00253F6F77|nr:CheY-like superfamily [Penicillium maclennaniae]KAJ5666065.1 CheY-like superfamily [Penicillium maclennaniae]
MSETPESDVPSSVPRPVMSFPSCKSEAANDGLATVNEDGNPHFDASGRSWNDGAQTTAIEHLVTLKEGLHTPDTELFWKRLMEDITSMGKAQYGFVARRVHGGEPMAELQGRRPILFGAAFYFNDGYQAVGMQRHRYFAGGNPLLHMDLERPCLIPENLKSLVAFRDDQLPFPAEAYLAIPLFFGGIVQRLLLDEEFTGQSLDSDATSDTSIVQNSQTVSFDDAFDFTSQPLKPYARSLSHELRTPMQGVVGMLDVMHATVREAMESKTPVKSGGIFQALKEGIEMVQDSARRAVEAADNVVHAYDLNMQVPKTPQREEENAMFEYQGSPPMTSERRPSVFIQGNNIAVNPYKRRRSLPPDMSSGGPAPRKQRTRASSTRQELSPRSEEVKNAVHESDQLVHATPARQIEAVMANMMDPRPSIAVRRSAPHLLLEGINMNTRGPALRFTKLRDLLRLVINESLHVGGRPDSAVSNATESGEKIEIRSKSSNGECHKKIVDWSVDPALPDTLLADDRDLAKLISCVFLNAIKFTNDGTITLCATIDTKTNDVLIRVRDTGPGIPEAFLPNLFKPFAREDAVSPGRWGGDLICVRSSTTGPDHGSEFQIRVPVNQREAYSRLGTPNERIITPPVISENSRQGSASSFWKLRHPFPRLCFRASCNSRHLAPVMRNILRVRNPPRTLPPSRSIRSHLNRDYYDKKLGEKFPLRFLVAEDNRINRRVLINMLRKLGYRDVLEAADGREAVQIVQDILSASIATNETNPDEDSSVIAQASDSSKMRPIDIVLMDLWMPEMDGYEATSRILQMMNDHQSQYSGPYDGSMQIGNTGNPDSMDFEPISPTLRAPQPPTVLAVSADVTDEALNRASKVGIKGYMTKPYKLSDLERLIVQFCGLTTDPAAA